MKPWAFSAILLLLATFAGASSPVDDQIFTIQGEDLLVSIKVLTINDPTEGILELVSPESKAGSAVALNSGFLSYRPRPDFHGLDRFRYRLAGEPHEAIVRVLVVPRITPLAGRWDDPDTDATGFYNSYTSTFFLCRSDRSTVPGHDWLQCGRYRFPSALPGWIGFVGDWSGTRTGKVLRGRPGLYDPVQQQIHLLNFESGSFCSECPEVQTLHEIGGWQLSQPPGDLPIPFDFAGHGTDAIGWYSIESGIVSFESSGELEWIEFKLDSLAAWPFVAATDTASPSAEAVGLYEPRTGEVEAHHSIAAPPFTPPATISPSPAGIAVAGKWDAWSAVKIAIYDRLNHRMILDPEATRSAADPLPLGVRQATFPDDPDDPPG